MGRVINLDVKTEMNIANHICDGQNINANINHKIKIYQNIDFNISKIKDLINKKKVK